ncbi:MAG: Hsp20/alpha crystallin family protein, partial [Bacteroidales bacterium]|nr:Hsp20/alpha crystallin family protein [Bacteroidales bacterium]
MMLLKRNENWLPGMLASMFDNDLMPKMQLTTPAINIKETEDAYELELAMPGMGREDFRLRLDDQG